MSKVKSGDTVTVHYTGTLVDGTEFDSSRGQEPLRFTVGEGSIIVGLENAVLGMRVGEKRTITVPCEQGYGEYNDQMMQTVARSELPDDIELTEGTVLRARNSEGQTMSFAVVAFDDKEVGVDGNHPLAGQDLTFDLELIAIA